MDPGTRMLRAITHQEVDRLPFCTYNCHPYRWGRNHRSHPSYAPILDRVAAGSGGYLCKVSARRCTEADDIVADKQIDNGDIVVTDTWDTPGGPLTRIRRWPAGQPGYCVKPFIDSDTDLDKYLSAPKRPCQWDVSDAVAQAREMGNAGLA